MKQQFTISHLGHRGDGIVHTETGPVFVPYALPGEIVEAERSGERAEIISVVAQSPERIDPVCPHFGICGGCAIQHWREDKYREWKRELVVSALTQAGIETKVDALMDAHGEGRRRTTLHARRGGKEKLNVGFAGRRSHEIVPIETCPVFAPALKPSIRIARRIAEILEPSAKPLDIQFTSAVNGLDVDIRGSGKISPAATGKLASIATEERLARITRHGELVARNVEPFVQAGKAKVLLPPGAFLQATLTGEETLAAIVIKAAEKSKHAIDLFCGIGTFALRLAESMKVSAIDSDASAIAALKRGANTPGLKPVEALARDLFRRPFTAPELSGFDLGVLDPPRQGAEAQVRELSKSKIRKIVYVSCSPASFARDAKILQDAGWKLGDVTPVDQFRYSAHVELVGVLTR